MKEKYLTPIVREQVLCAVNDLKKRKNQYFNNEKEVMDFFHPFYESVKSLLDDNIENFLNLITLEIQYGFVSGFMGGATLNNNDDTIIKTNSMNILKIFVDEMPDGCINCDLCVDRICIPTKRRRDFAFVHNMHNVLDNCPLEFVEKEQPKQPCDHPKDMQTSYHDGAILCEKCNCIIAQYGKFFDEPTPLI